MKLKYNPPSIIKNIFNQFHWETTSGKLLLTFDDGPNPATTEKILFALNHHKMKALFFCVGNNISKYKDLTKSIFDEGHSIGNHTFNHKILTKENRETIIRELEMFDSILSEEYNYKTKYFRPPHGRFNLKVKKIISQAGLECVMWSLLTYDYQNDFKKVKFAVDNYLLKNSIIVLHDSNKSKDIIVDSINYIIDKAFSNGFQFGEPAECLN